MGVGRDAKRCAETEASIRREVPGARVDYFVADLASQRQVRDLAAAIRRLLETENGGCLDLLVNNAGAVSSWYVTTEDGYEMQFAVNHLAPFLLTRELLPLLKKAGSARVITTSSGSHYNTRINWRDVMYRRGYNCLRAYKQSKLANVLSPVNLTAGRAGFRHPCLCRGSGPGEYGDRRKRDKWLCQLVWRIRRKGVLLRRSLPGPLSIWRPHRLEGRRRFTGRTAGPNGPAVIPKERRRAAGEFGTVDQIRVAVRERAQVRKPGKRGFR